MTCRWCKGTGLYQPLTGPSEPCRECQVVAPVHASDGTPVHASDGKIGGIFYVKKPQRYTSVALRINDMLKEYLEVNGLIGPPYPIFESDPSTD